MKNNKYNLEGKKLLLLGSTRNDLEFIKTCRSLGVKVGVTDWKNLEEAPAKREADFAHFISLADTDEIVKLIKDCNYDGVITGFSDGYLKYYQEICDKAGLPCYATKEQFEILTNKTKYKELMTKFNVPNLKNYSINEIDERFVNYPLMIKPAEGSGGKGLNIARNYEEYQTIIESITNKQGLVIEPYIENRLELTAFYVFVDGNIELVSTANRFLSDKQGKKIGLPILYTMPSSFDKKFRQEVHPYFKNMFEKMNIKNGILFAQCLLHNDTINVYDIGYRVTGTMEFKLFNELFGIDTLKMLICFAITGDMNFYNNIAFPENFKQMAFNLTMQGKEGKVSRIEGVDSILNMNDIIDIAIKTAPGDRITKEMIGTLEQIVARIFFTSNNLHSGLDKIKELYDILEIIDTEGNNMLLQKMDLDFVYNLYNGDLI